MAIKSILKKIVPDFVFRLLSNSGLYPNFRPATGNVKMGDLRRLVPLSVSLGADRGGAIDRYYIQNFLLRNKDDVKGRVLEIGDNKYTLQYGAGTVERSDILHIDITNPKATFIGDLSDAPDLPDNTFDCIILTQTLQYIYNCKNALQTCRRILKPGGTLLLTVPGISPVSRDAWSDKWCWTFTTTSIHKLLSETFAMDEIFIENFGNVLSATCFLMGMGSKEIKRSELEFTDKHYPVVIAAKAIKHNDHF